MCHIANIRDFFTVQSNFCCLQRGGRGKRGSNTPAGTPITPRTAAALQARNSRGGEEKAAASMTALKKVEKSAAKASPAAASGSAGKRGRQSLPVVSPATKDEEYVLVQSGPNTGLTGKYWADLENLPARRSRRSVQQSKVVDSRNCWMPN